MASIEERAAQLRKKLQGDTSDTNSVSSRANQLRERLSRASDEPIRRTYTPASNHVAESGTSAKSATSIVPVIERQEAYKPSNLLDMTDDELSVREDALQQLVNSNRFRSQELNLGTDAAARQAEENLKALQEARGLKRLGAYSDEELRGMSLADIDETVRQLNEQLKYAKDNQMDAQALEYQSQIDALQGARGQRLQGKAQSYDDFTAEELQERLANLERQQNALYQKSTSTGDGRYYQDATRMGYQKEELQQANYLAKVRETDEDTMQMTLDAIRKQMELADLMQQEGTYRDVNPWFAVSFGTPSEEQGSAYENIKALSAEADAALQAAKAKAHNTGADWTTLEHYAESQINKERADAMTENAKNTVEDADSIVGAMLRHSGSQIFGGLGALNMTAQAIGNAFRGSENYLPIDPNTNYNRYSILADAYQQGGAELVEKYAAADPILGKFLTGKDYITGDQSRAQYLYNVGVSSLDSAVNLGVAMLLSAGISGFVPMDAQTFNTTSARLVNAIMGSSAATSAIRENLKSGDMTDAQAVTLGIMSGVAEAMTESWSIETLLNGDTTAFARLINRMVKNPVANNLLKGFISEGSEEIASNWLNRLFDYIVRHDKSETMQDYNAYLAQGDSSGEAWRKIFAEWLQEDASAGLAGSLAGLTGGASHYALTGTVDSVDTYVTEREAEKARLQAEQNAQQEAQTQQTTAQNAQQEQKKAAAQPTAQNVQQNTAEQQKAQTAENTQQERPAARQVYDKQQLQKSADTLGDHGSKALMTAYDSEASANVNAGDFYRGFLEYYQAGVNDVRMEKVSGEFADRLNSAQKYAAYVSGQNDAQQTLEREQRAKNFAQVAGTDKGLVYDDYVNEVLASGKEERLTMDDVNTLAKDLGLRVRFVDSIRGGDANATISGAEVLIEKNNPNPVMFLAGHEFTHRLQELAPDEYRAFRQIVAESRNDYIQERIDNYAAHDIQLDYQDALDEEAADYGGRLLLDGEVLDDFINKHHTERNLLEKMLDAIRAFIEKVTGAAKKQAQTAEGKLLKALEAATEQAKKLEQNKNAATTGGEVQSGVKMSLKGTNRYGIEVYETDASIKALPKKERIAVYLDLMRNMYSGRTARFIRNGHTYYAVFDQSSLRKPVYGDNRSSRRGVTALINAGASGDIFDLVENSTYKGSAVNTKDHTNADYFDYFVKTVQIDGQVFDLFADVEKSYGTDGGYTYTVALKNNKKIEATPHSELPFQEPVKNAGPASGNSISTNQENVNRKFSLKNDSNGRRLSEQQEEYFKDSKVVDEDGNLLVVYHGTDADFTVFDRSKSRANMDIQGNFFSPWEIDAKGYGSNVSAYYLNITNPANEGTAYKALNRFKGQNEAGVKAREYLISLGYDGVNNSGEEYIAFYPEQIKRTDNSNPTSNPDIRYSLKQFDDGKRFVDVETDQAQFDGLSLNEMNMLAHKIIKQKYGNKVVGIDNRVYVNGKSAEEYVYFKRGTPKEIIEAKARAATELDNLIDAGTNFRTAEDGADGHVHPDAPGGFSYFDTIFKVGPEYYKGVVNIKNNGRGKLFWGVTKTENITQDIYASYGKNPTSTFLRDVSMETVTQEKESVKGKTSKEEIGSGSKSSLKAGTVSNTLAAMQEENDLLKEQVKDYRALQKRIAQLAESRDYWKGQTQRTQTVTTDKKAVAKAAKDLVKNYSATTAISEVQQRLQSLYDYIAAGGEDFSYQYARKQAEALAADLVNSAVETDSELYDEYKELRQYLKTTPIRIGADVQSEVAHYNELRKANMGRLKLTGGQGTNIDQVYQQLAEQWPEFFDEGVQSNPGDQLQRISDVLSDIYHVAEQNPYSQYMAEATAGAANEILETFFDLPQTKATFADRQAKKLQETKAKGQLQLAALREQNRQRMEELRQKNRERVQTVMEKERDKRNEQLQKLKDRYAEKDAGRRERQRAKELRAKITKHANALSRKLLSPNDKQHIPENLRGPVAALLSSLNQESKRSDQRTEAFRVLRDRYASILADGGDMVIDPSLLGTKADGFTASFDAVIDMGSIPLEDMSVEQLNTVWQVVKAVEHSVSTAGKILSKAKYDSTQDWAQAISIGSSTRKNRNAWRKNRLSLDLETPYTFFSHFGEAGNAIYRMLRDAQDQQVLLKRQVSEAVQDIVEPKTVRALQRETHEFTTERGEKVTLSTAHLMELYELSKREQAHDHLLEGGIVQPEIEGTKIKRGTDSILLSENDLGAMIGTLDREQLEIADRLQRLTTGLLADMGNRASMQAYGYKKFTGKDYWPIKSAKEGLHYSIEKNGENSRSIKNIGMAKSVMPGANNALELQGVFHTFANHAADMIDYAAWLCPMEDVNRVYNFEFRDMEGNRTGKTVKGVLEAVGGPGSQKYWQTLMDNIQNGINSRSDSPMWDAVGKLVGTFKGAKVAANIRVILQQPTAFFRAAAVLSPKDMTRGLVKGVTNGDGWEKALTYSPIAMRKDDGGFDISAPRSMYESFFDQRSVVRKINDALGEPAGKADAITWGKLWNACEWATKRDYPDLTVGSEAFYRQTARTFAEMIDQTQVVDGVLQRANIMRSKNEVMKQATAFMGEPLMSLNLMMRTWDQYRYEQNNEKRIKAMKAMGRAGVALLVTNVVNAFVQSLVDAMRDDDPDKKYWERLKTAFTGQTGDEENIWEKLKNFTLNGNVGQNLNMAGNIPIAKDILSLIQGYDVSRTEYETIGSFIQAAQTVIASIDGSGGRTVSSALADLFATAAEFFGLPAKNIKRDMFGLIHSFANEMDNIPLQYEMAKVTYKLGDKNKGRFYDIMYRALELGDLDTFNHIREELMESSEVNGKDIDSAMKSRYNKAVKNDPNYQLPSTTRSIFGSFDKYQKPAEDEFDEGDLNSTQYKSFSDQRSREFNEMQYHLDNNPIFKGMDAESRSKVLQAAYDLAKERALEDNSGGQYETDTKWIQAADEVEDAGIELWEYALFRAEYNMAETERDEKGKVIKGKSTSDKTRDWLEDYDDFTKKQKKVLWGTVYESKW